MPNTLKLNLLGIAAAFTFSMGLLLEMHRTLLSSSRKPEGLSGIHSRFGDYGA